MQRLLLSNYRPAVPFNLSGAECFLYQNGKQIYTYRALYSAYPYWLVSHQDGNRYFVFSQDLYGYSVLNLSTLKEHHFFPAESFPKGETFIWVKGCYNPKNNIMAVEGCYWACPYSVVLVDFTKPMQDTLQINTNVYIENKYPNSYGHVDFLRWEGSDLLLQAETNTEPEQTEVLTIPGHVYLAGFTGSE